LKALIVDNDKLVRILIIKVLNKLVGCEIAEAENGLEAITKLKEDIPDFILLDLHMPIMSGVEVLEVLRNDPNLKNIPVIIMSSTDDKKVIVELLKLGIADYILKPIDVNNIQDRLTKVLLKQSKKESEKKSFSPVYDEDIDFPGAKLLVIDNDESFRTKIFTNLSGDFYVIEASSGIEGLQMFLSNKPAVVVISEGLNLLNESILARKIKSQHETKIIFCANNVQETPNSLYDYVIKKEPDSESFFSELRDYCLS